MSFKEQFFSKEYNKEELMTGYVHNLSYEEYIYYVACLSDYFYKVRQYKKSLFFYDHLIRSIGCGMILSKYERSGRKVPKEYTKYLVDLNELTNSKEAEELGSKVDKIAAKHTTKRFFFQLLMILGGLIVGVVMYLFGVGQNICLITGFAVAAIVPILYRPKAITLDGEIGLEKSLLYVSRHNKDLIEFVQQKIRKDKKYKESQNEVEETKSAE